MIQWTNGLKRSPRCGGWYEAAGPYLDSLTDRPVHDPAASRCWTAWRPAARQGAGTAEQRSRRLLRDRYGDRHRVGRAALLPLRHRRGDARPRSPPTGSASLLDQNAFARASSRAGHEVETVALDWLRELVGLPAGLGRRAGGERHVRQLHRAGAAPPTGGPSGTASTRRRRARRAAPDAGAVRRLRAPERPQGAADARPRQRRGRGVRPRRGRPGGPGRAGRRLASSRARRRSSSRTRAR